jgi:uncharacterized protein YbdZ (MbtH family)
MLDNKLFSIMLAKRSQKHTAPEGWNITTTRTNRYLCLDRINPNRWLKIRPSVEDRRINIGIVGAKSNRNAFVSFVNAHNPLGITLDINSNTKLIVQHIVDPYGDRFDMYAVILPQCSSENTLERHR